MFQHALQFDARTVLNGAIFPAGACVSSGDQPAEVRVAGPALGKEYEMKRLACVLNGQLAAGNCLQPCGLCRMGERQRRTEVVVVRQGECGVAKCRSAIDQLVGLSNPVEKGVRRMTVQLYVRRTSAHVATIGPGCVDPRRLSAAVHPRAPRRGSVVDRACSTSPLPRAIPRAAKAPPARPRCSDTGARRVSRDSAVVPARRVPGAGHSSSSQPVAPFG